MSGQHVGSVSDSISTDDDGRSAAREAFKRVMKPSGRRYSGTSDLGDGDRCPLVPEHGRMLASKDHQTQYCPHQSHDGIWGEGGKRPPTRNRWPLADGAFEAAVKEHLTHA